MTFKPFLLAGLIPLLSDCHLSDYQEGPFNSPSRKYSVEAKVNRTDNTKATYASVQVILLDAAGHQIDSIDSRAGDFSKWALGWMPKGDTIVLHSSDIGPGAWWINPAGRLQKIDAISSRINVRADELKSLKDQP